MSLSLREQLLAAGLGTKKQAKKAEQQERAQQHKDRHKEKSTAERERELAAEKARAAKLARDQELMRQRQLAQEQRERVAQLKQFVEQHRIPKPDSDEYFNFIHRDKVRRVPVDEALRQRILNGEVTILRCEGKYELVPTAAVEKIRERNERAIVVLPKEDSQPAEDDPYKDFVVPDDLKW
jgi:uncharacterized protein YaiL (DUF2058 family)